MRRGYNDLAEIVAELDRLQSHIAKLAGERLREDMEALQRCLYVFGRNHVDLSEHISHFTQSSTEAPEVSNTCVDELVRLLHNFLTSITTYIDSQRVVMRHRWPTAEGHSQFELGEYTKQRRSVFETGQAEFITRLRNYCTHYSVLVPNLRTAITFGDGIDVQRSNHLNLDRDALLRWDGWGAPAEEFLRKQNEQIDFPPIVDSFIGSTQRFFHWFWNRINELSTDLIDERNARVTEVRLWWEEYQPSSDWELRNDEPTPLGRSRRERALQRRKRYEHGFRGYRLIDVDPNGIANVGDTDWKAPFA